MVLSISLGWYSDKHIEQVLSLGLGNSRLSPRKVFGYDSIMRPSRPITKAACCGIVEVESCVLGPWLLSLTRLHRQHVSPMKHNSPGIPMPMVKPYLTLLRIPKREKNYNYLVSGKIIKKQFINFNLAKSLVV